MNEKDYQKDMFTSKDTAMIALFLSLEKHGMDIVRARNYAIQVYQPRGPEYFTNKEQL